MFRVPNTRGSPFTESRAGSGAAFDGVKLQSDLGAAGMQNDIDLRPNYTLNWLPPAGTSAIIKVRLMYILKGNDTGTWSDWQQWTLTGV